MGISTNFKIISKLYNNGMGMTSGVCLTCKSMQLILTIKNIYGMGGDQYQFQDYFQIV